MAVLGVVYDSLLNNGYAESCVRWLVLFATIIPYCIAGGLFLYTSVIFMEEKTAERDSEANPLLSRKV